MQPIVNHPRSKASAAGIDIFLSLYLILIGFFLILNITAVPRADRAEAVIDSVRKVFAGDGAETIRNAEESSGGAEKRRRDAFNQAVRVVLASLVENYDRRALAGGDQVRIMMPVRAFFGPGSADFRRDKLPFIRRLATLLLGAEEGYPRQVGLYVSTPLAEGDDDLALARAGAIAAVLEAQGPVASRASIGLTDGRRDQILLVFSQQGERRLNASSPTAGAATP